MISNAIKKIEYEANIANNMSHYAEGLINNV